VAVKVLPPSRAKNTQVLARFEREARLALKLKHPHVVRAFQVGETKGVHYFVMEYLEGETFDELLARRKRLPPAEAVRLVHQALLGLQHIHEMGMVHRDLKPANLMLLANSSRTDTDTTLNSIVKILDIGLAREFFDENSPAEAMAKMELTGEGTLLGTPDYLAPEQARDPRTIDIRADIYSLGCTLYHLLAGQTPFPDKNILNQMIRHATETPKPLQSFNESIPDGLAQIVDWMMAKQPAQRYPTPGRAAQALDAFLMVTSETAKPIEETPQLRKYLTWLETSGEMQPEANQTSQPAATIPPVALPAPPTAKPAALPTAPAAEAKPDRKRKKPIGAKSAPAPIPVAAATPVVLPAIERMPTADQLDVELVALPEAPTPTSSRGSVLRDILLISGGAIGMLLVVGLAGIVYLVIRALS
jgi:eukaryotic-like serine/threonine-protein kinase